MAPKPHKYVWYKKACTGNAQWERTHLGGRSIAEAHNCMHLSSTAGVFACNVVKLVDEAAGERP